MKFEQLYLQQHQQLRSYINRRVWNYELRDDIEQETWIAIHNRWEDYDPSRPFLPWVKGFFDNARRKVVRKEVVEWQGRKDYTLHLERQTEEEIADIAPDWLRKQPDMFNMFKGHYVERNTLKEVAQDLGIDYNKIRKMNCRLKKMLKEHYDRPGPEQG